MMIKRTALGSQPKAAAWVNDPWGWGGSHPFADQVHEGEYPSHSPVLGPDGRALKYEPRQGLGFDLRPRK